MLVHGYAALSPSLLVEPFSYRARELKPFEILIKISHSGLCHTDLYMLENLWKRSTYPLLPGHEIVGTIVQKGPYALHNIGDRVAAGWVRSSCLSCPLCLDGKTNICQTKQSIYNLGEFGGFADHVIADSRFVFLAPPEIRSMHLAPLLCAGATVFSPLLTQNIKPGHCVGVIGIGGLGHLALQFYRAFGCEVSAISSSCAKEEESKQLGASHFYLHGNMPKKPTFDFLLCTAEGNLPWNDYLAALHPQGILCIVSRPLEGIAFDPFLLVSSERKICGSNNASRGDMNRMLQFAGKHQILPWVEEMPISRINEGILRLRQNKVRYRIVFQCS